MGAEEEADREQVQVREAVRVREAQQAEARRAASIRQGARGLGGRGAGRMDLETILERAPLIQLAGLQKGEAVMIVATEDSSGVSAVKLLAGVEPLLEAPQAQDLLSSWSLSSGDSGAGTD